MLEQIFMSVNHFIGSIIFFDLFFFTDSVQLPFIVAWIAAAALFLTYQLRFVNLLGFPAALKMFFGPQNDVNKINQVKGMVTPRQALFSAISGTVGLGNIAGVAIAVSIGGPGATFWMIVCGLLGMTSKFTEVTLAHKYKKIGDNGKVMGGPMMYLREGLAKRGKVRLGKMLAASFAVFCIMGSFGGGNAFQVNQSFNAVYTNIPWFEDKGWLYGLIMVTIVGLVIIGGVKRIATTASKIVPFMSVAYLFMVVVVVSFHISSVPIMLKLIFTEAFSPSAVYGGVLGVLVTGFRRAVFSNEAGVGSAPIVHSAAKVEHPIQGGLIALLEPFIDTVVICTLTSMILLISGAYNNPEYAALIATKSGAALTSEALSQTVSWFPMLLTATILLFAFSTMISWSYYGQRCWVYLFGHKAEKLYNVLFLIFVYLGAVTSSAQILEFSDLMILCMALPNLVGVLWLHKEVVILLKDYQARKLYPEINNFNKSNIKIIKEENA